MLAIMKVGLPVIVKHIAVNNSYIVFQGIICITHYLSLDNE